MSASRIPLFQDKGEEGSKGTSMFGAPGSTKRRNVLIAGVTIGLAVIIAAVVGGVVGGTKSKHNHNAAAAAPPSSTPSLPTSPSPGCNKASPWNFDDTGHSNVTMGNRTFYVHQPASYNDAKAHAVVLSFHGYSQNETEQEYITGLSEAGIDINNLGIVAVYPAGAWGPGKPGDGPQRAWEGAPYSAPFVDDIAFTQDMLQELGQNLCVDTSRLFASGKSNGGGFVNLLACTATTANILAAYAPVSAALYAAGTDSFSGCNPGRSIPMVNLHGEDDTIEPITGQAEEYGNTGYATPDINAWRQAWAGRDGCTDPSSDGVIENDVFKATMLETWNCSSSDPRATIQGYTIAGLGHSWPSTTGADGGYTSFNATTAVIIPFFQQFTI